MKDLHIIAETEPSLDVRLQFTVDGILKGEALVDWEIWEVLNPLLNQYSIEDRTF